MDCRRIPSRLLVRLYGVELKMIVSGSLFRMAAQLLVALVACLRVFQLFPMISLQRKPTAGAQSRPCLYTRLLRRHAIDQTASSLRFNGGPFSEAPRWQIRRGPRSSQARACRGVVIESEKRAEKHRYPVSTVESRIRLGNADRKRRLRAIRSISTRRVMKLG